MTTSGVSSASTLPPSGLLTIKWRFVFSGYTSGHHEAASDVGPDFIGLRARVAHNTPSMGPGPNWSLTGNALERLLSRLDSDREAAGRRYEKLRRKLADYFESHGSTCPDAQADEVLDRVAHKLEQGETIKRVERYALGVARLVSLEWDKRRAGEQEAVAALSAALDEAPGHDVEQLAAELEACLKELPERSRALVLAYYQEDVGSRGWTASRVPGGRRRLARAWGLSYENLKVRVHRLRERLEECLRLRLP